MRDALNQRFDVVLAEALDRFSRDQEDTAGLFKRLTFAGVNIVTLAEGDITHLHVGLKGTMNALFVKDLADKTRRGLRGRVELGKSGGGLCYGYKVACFGARSRGTCTNRLTISRQEVEERVLVALRDKLMRRDLFEDFCREYVRELNRLRMEHRAGLSSARTELTRVESEIRKLVQAIKDGVPALSIKDELLSLE